MNFELILYYITPALIISAGLGAISIVIQLWFNSWGGMIFQKRFPMFMTKKTALKLIALRKEVEEFEYGIKR